VGKTFSAHGECGSFTTEVSGKITGTKQVTLDGKAVETFVVETTIATHGQVESTGSQVDWFAPSLRMAVHSEGHQQGTYSFVSSKRDSVGDLESAKPS